MQVLNLGAAAIPIYRDHQLSTYTRVSMLAMSGLGLFFIVGAMVLYTLVPTEWSAMINCMGGAVQCFVLVQVLIEKKEKRD